MPKRIVVFVLIAVIFAALFIRLGFWQLSRLAQRRALNALVTARLEEPLVDVTTLPADSSSVLRRTYVTGVPDYAHQVILADRSYNGSPGVYLLTPVRVAGRDSAILVNRGWVYAPDGVTIDAQRWRDRDSTFVGYAGLLATRSRFGANGALRPGVVRELDQPAVSAAVPYPVSRLYLVATQPDSAIPAVERVARLSPPPLDEGPHLSYAIQWFSFAAIALIGAGAVAMRGAAGGG